MSGRGEESGLVVVVTGGCGFLGARIVDSLLAKDWVQEVRVLDVSYGALASAGASSSSSTVGARLTRLRGSVTSVADVRAALWGADVVVHTVAIVSEGFMAAAAVEAVNVGGTRTVLEACCDVADGPRCAVYAGSVTACITGGAAAPELDESSALPSPTATVGGEYARTKNLAERLVLSYDGRARRRGRGRHGDSEPPPLRTCVLRCPPMYGEGDPYVLTPLLGAARATFGRVASVGDGVLVQLGYVGNVAEAFAVAAERMAAEPAAVGGRPFFVTDDTPAQPMIDFARPIAARLGYSVLPFSIPTGALLVLAYVVQFLVMLVSLVYPVRLSGFQLTPARVRLIRSSHTFSGALFRAATGFRPPYPVETALERTIEFHCRQLGR